MHLQDVVCTTGGKTFTMISGPSNKACVGAIPSLAMKAHATLGVGVREAMAMRTPHSLRRASISS